MPKNIAIIGLGRFGSSIAITLCKLGHQVLAVDMNPELVQAISSHVTHAVEADATNERALSQLGIRNFDCVIVSIGDDIRASTLATILCKEMGAAYVIAKASDELHAKLLNKTGADKVVLPEWESGVRLARSLVSKSVIDYLELSEKYSVSEMRMPLRWVGKSLSQINVRARFKVSVIALRRDDKIIIALDPKAPLEANDVLVLLGANEDLTKIEGMET